MDATIFLVVVLGLALVAVFLMTNRNLRDTLRSFFTARQVQAATALDDAMDRMETAQVENENQLVKANQGLLAIKTENSRLSRQIADADADATRYDRAAEMAASKGNAELAREALVRANTARTRAAELRMLVEGVEAREDQVETAVKKLMDRKAELKKKAVEVKTRARTAQVNLSVNQLLAGVDLSGRSKDVERALEIVEDLEAKAGAMGEVAAVATRDEDIERQLAELASPAADVDEQLAALMAKHAPAASAAQPASSAEDTSLTEEVDSAS